MEGFSFFDKVKQAASKVGSFVSKGANKVGSFAALVARRWGLLQL